MATPAPKIADIALQFEIATAQLRVLSALPEAQHQGQVQTAIDDFKTRMDNMEKSMKKLTSEVQSLRDTTEIRMKSVEAQAYNNKMRTNNHRFQSASTELAPLRNVNTNQEISNFPTTADMVCSLDDNRLNTLCDAIGWNVKISGWSLREKRQFLLQ